MFSDEFGLTDHKTSKIPLKFSIRMFHFNRFPIKTKRGHGLIGIKVYTSITLAGIPRSERNMEDQETGKMTLREAGWQPATSAASQAHLHNPPQLISTTGS